MGRDCLVGLLFVIAIFSMCDVILGLDQQDCGTYARCDTDEFCDGAQTCVNCAHSKACHPASNPQCKIICPEFVSATPTATEPVSQSIQDLEEKVAVHKSIVHKLVVGFKTAAIVLSVLVCLAVLLVAIWFKKWRPRRKVAEDVELQEKLYDHDDRQHQHEEELEDVAGGGGGAGGGGAAAAAAGGDDGGGDDGGDDDDDGEGDEENPKRPSLPVSPEDESTDVNMIMRDGGTYRRP